jgi:hypothetical protein
MPLEALVNNWVWWCFSHKRRAMSVNNRGNHCCDPSLGGVMTPCRCTKVTEKDLVTEGYLEP